MIAIIDENGISKDVEILHYFTLNSNGRDYIVYTDHLEDEQGNIFVYTSEVVEREDRIEFAHIESKDVLGEIGKILGELTEEKVNVYDFE